MGPKARVSNHNPRQSQSLSDIENRAFSVILRRTMNCLMPSPESNLPNVKTMYLFWPESHNLCCFIAAANDFYRVMFKILNIFSHLVGSIGSFGKKAY